MNVGSWCSEVLQVAEKVWPTLVTLGVAVSATLAAGHAVMTKEDERAAVGWVGIILLVPALGPLLYLLFGINRIRRRAISYAPERALGEPSHRGGALTGPYDDPSVAPLIPLCRLGHHVTRRPLLPGNAVDMLQNGDQAYPAILAAIDGAQRSVALCTYIFDNDVAGQMFRAALLRAQQRGVQVRVLIDAVGSRYSWPTMVRALRHDGIPVALFGQTRWPWRMPYANLRNHRKIILVDGKVGFTGGMNIRVGHLLQQNPKRPVADVHFCVRGPVLSQLWEAFRQDWTFTTRESLTCPEWAVHTEPQGSVWARGIAEGPDENVDKLHWLMMGALACAQTSVYVVTPYFLPEQSLIAALDTAAMRGVAVHILLPRHNNLFLVKWASTALLPRLLRTGVRIYLTGQAFDHSKLMLVDGVWSMIGSANWDPRSLRLNFEFNIECYDVALHQQLQTLVDIKLRDATRLSPADLARRPFLTQLRDNIARLVSPYL